ncbi:YihY/virulence factor BrkB family protein [Sinosporangium album]|uniref:YihY/virulence factor BrkB family protein n=1 Tax=Sinosporangium album TaxID=504805 RepID=UPI001FE191E9|nr:YhjD/YihY/BrkB family envelope integrity protein [Sinosporangium album]
MTSRERVRHPWVDHLIRTVQRYQVQYGDRLAGAVTYFAFLSFFPILALAFAVFGYIVTFRPDALQVLTNAINGQLPGLAEQLDVAHLGEARFSAGLIGVLGLLYAGLGAIDALRGALRQIWMTTEPPLNFALAKLRDLATLFMLGLTLIVSTVVTGLATSAGAIVTGWVGLDGSAVAERAVWLAGVLVGVAADIVLFLIVLGWVAKPSQPFRTILKGAVLGAIGFGVLKQIAALVLPVTLNNPIYGAFAVMVGLLIWINLSARLTLYVAAWTATADMGPPPAPTPVPGLGMPRSPGPALNGHGP